MIGSPAPWIVTDPGPAVVIDPNPSSRLIWGPIRTNRGSPNVAVLRVVRPAAVAVQILCAVDVRANVLSGRGPQQVLVATRVPAIPFILRISSDHLIFGIGDGAADDHGFAGSNLFGTARSVDVGVAFTNRNLARSIGLNGDAVNSLPRGPHRDIG